MNLLKNKIYIKKKIRSMIVFGQFRHFMDPRRQKT